MDHPLADAVPSSPRQQMEVQLRDAKVTDTILDPLYFADADTQRRQSESLETEEKQNYETFDLQSVEEIPVKLWSVNDVASWFNRNVTFPSERMEGCLSFQRITHISSAYRRHQQRCPFADSCKLFRVIMKGERDFSDKQKAVCNGILNVEFQEELEQHFLVNLCRSLLQYCIITAYRDLYESSGRQLCNENPWGHLRYRKESFGV